MVSNGVTAPVTRARGCGNLVMPRFGGHVNAEISVSEVTYRNVVRGSGSTEVSVEAQCKWSGPLGRARFVAHPSRAYVTAILTSPH